MALIRSWRIFIELSRSVSDDIKDAILPCAIEFSFERYSICTDSGVVAKPLDFLAGCLAVTVVVLGRVPVRVTGTGGAVKVMEGRRTKEGV